jgi:hypothetical protein
MYDNPVLMSQRSGLNLGGMPKPKDEKESKDEPSQLATAMGKVAIKPSRRFPEEEDEDLLRETDDRFVLFPIKYREVSAYL